MRARAISRPLSVQVMPGIHAVLRCWGIEEDSSADPLSDDPTVVGELANLSPLRQSTNENADIYLGEFMLLYSHHAFHQSANQKRSPTLDQLCADDWWKIQCDHTSRPRRRVYFSGALA